MKEEPDPKSFGIGWNFTWSQYHMSTFWNPIPGIRWKFTWSLESGETSPDPKSRWADCYPTLPTYFQKVKCFFLFLHTVCFEHYDIDIKKDDWYTRWSYIKSEYGCQIKCWEDSEWVNNLLSFWLSFYQLLLILIIKLSKYYL